MNDDREVFRRLIENRDQLSDEELAALVDLLRTRPDLVIELKDQFIVDDLLAQKFDLTRWHFLSQVDQRLRDESKGFSGIDPDDLIQKSRVIESAEEAGSATPEQEPLLQRASGENQPNRKLNRRVNRPRSRLRFLAAAMILLAALGTGGYWIYTDRGRIGFVEVVVGPVELVRLGRSQPATSLAPLLGNDRLITLANSSVVVRYRDGTSLKINAETSADLFAPSLDAPGKRVFVAQGGVSADVVTQPEGMPMTFESANATAEVLGTALQFQVAAKETHVTVNEGRVRVNRKSDRESIVIHRDQFAVISKETVASAPVGWPSDRKGLIFVFGTNDQPNLVRSSSTGINRSFSLRPRGSAHLNHDYALVLTGGAFLAEDVDGEILIGCRQTSQLTVEATVQPSVAEQVGPARIVTFSTNVVERDFTLGQLGDQLIVRIRTPQTGPNGVGGVDPGLPVCKLAVGEPNHIIVSYKPGKLICYRNGKLVFDGKQIQGDFSDWSAQHLLFGDEYAGERNWAGLLEGVAIYNRFVEPDEAARNALQYEHLRQSRPVVSQFRVRAKLIAKSALLSAAAIQPHRSALVVCKYQVTKVLDGNLKQTDLLVAQWSLLDGKNQPIVDLPIGSETDLMLESFDRNPQAQRYLCSDDFPLEEEGMRYLEIRQ